jgi:hypothetical protein
VLYYNGLDQAGNTQAFRATRTSASSAFAVGSQVPGVPNSLFDPTTNITETVLYMHSGQGRLQRMTRPTTSVDFSDLTDIGVPGFEAFLSPTTLTFATGALGSRDLYVASLSGGVVGPPARIDSLATAADETNPVVSADDLEIAFVRGAGIVDARRTAMTDEFGDIQSVQPGVTGTIQPAGFSRDRCRLYLTIVETGSSASLYVMSRP